MAYTFQVCLVTLQLFDTLLQKDEEHILNNLVLRNLATRGYYDTNYHGDTKELPRHIQEEFSNIVNQSVKNGKNKGNFTEGAENPSEKIVHKHVDEGKECAIETCESHTESDNPKADKSDNSEFLDKDKETAKDDLVVGKTDRIQEDSESSKYSHELTDKAKEPCSEGQEIVSITSVESSKPENIPTEAKCDNNETVGAENLVESHVDNQEMCNNLENVKSPDVEASKDGLIEVTEKLTVSSADSDSEGQNMLKNEEKKSSSVQHVIQIPKEQPNNGLGTYTTSPRRSRIEVHNIVNW